MDCRFHDVASTMDNVARAAKQCMLLVILPVQAVWLSTPVEVTHAAVGLERVDTVQGSAALC